jgi:lysophospholipase L1-like esterase
MSVQVSYKKQFTVYLIFIIIVLSAVELSARIYEYSPISTQCQFTDSPIFEKTDYFLMKQMCIDHNYIKYSTFPNSSVPSHEPNTTDTININSFGLRGPEFDQEKPDNTYRIFIVGGSSTFGTGVTDENTITGIMQKLFEYSNPEWNIEVINAGIPGAESFRETWLIRNILFELEPDFIINFGGFNEARQVTEVFEREAYRNYIDYNEVNNSIESKNIESEFNLFKFNNYSFYRTPFVIYDIFVKDLKEKEFKNKNELDNDKIVKEYYENWKDICQSSTKKNIHTMIILQSGPGLTDRNIFDGEIKVTEDIEIIYPLLNAALNELAKDCSITEDYRTIFDDISHPIYIDEIHMGKEGNKIIAEKIYEKILPIITKDILKILFE